METGCACWGEGEGGVAKGWQGCKDAVTTKWRQMSGPRETAMQLCMQIAPAGSPSLAKQFINEICWKVGGKKRTFFEKFLVIESRQRSR